MREEEPDAALDKGVAAHPEHEGQMRDYQPPYGDLSELNTCRVLLNAVGEDVLHDIVGDLLDLLGTSAAVYEKNGDYALGLFASGWCRFLDQASRNLCASDGNKEALANGQWHCHESCWTDASRISIETGQPVDIECRGGIGLYAVPIWAGEEIVGSVNIGYGDPPRELAEVQPIAQRYGLGVEGLLKQAETYHSRPPFIIDIVKGRLSSSARLIGKIVELKRAKEALERNEKILSESQRIARLGGWALDLETGQLACTEEVYRIHEVPTDRLLSLEYALSFYEPQDRAILEAAMRRGVESGEPWDLELPFTSAMGRHLWVRAKGKVEYREGQPVKLSGTFQDISERKQAEETRSLLASIVESSSEAIVSTTLDGVILSWNPGAEWIFGRSSLETVGRSLALLISAERADLVRDLLHQAAGGKQSEPFEMTVRRRDGRQIDISVTVSPIRDGRDRIGGVAAIISDITTLKQAERAMHRANEELELAVQELSRDLFRVGEELQALALTEREERQLAEALTRAGLALSQSLSPEELLETLLDRMAELIPYDSAEVLLWQDSTHLAVPAIRGHDGWADPRQLSAAAVEVGVNPIIERLLVEDRSLLIDDTRTFPEWRHPLSAPRTLNWLGVPLAAGDKIIGLCGLSKAEPGFFTRQHVRLAEALAGQAAVAVEKVSLFDQVCAGRERLKSLARGLVEVQETERCYVARELHDEAGQALSALRIGLRMLERDARRPESILADVAELRRIVDRVQENLHRLAVDLRPVSLDHLGLVAALRQHLEAVSRKHDLVIRFETLDLDERLPSEMETNLYRAAQEALTNVVRHSQATRVEVLLAQQSDKLRMIIEDNGVGFDSSVVSNSDRLGLFGIRERMEMLDGTFTIESAAGAGTALLLEVPYVRAHSPGR
ncbi:MAG: PAS domain S-box protein [Anaerolineae bacterium]